MNTKKSLAKGSRVYLTETELNLIGRQCALRTIAWFEEKGQRIVQTGIRLKPEFLTQTIKEVLPASRQVKILGKSDVRYGRIMDHCNDRIVELMRQRQEEELEEPEEPEMLAVQRAVEAGVEHTEPASLSALPLHVQCLHKVMQGFCAQVRVLQESLPEHELAEVMEEWQDCEEVNWLFGCRQVIETAPEVVKQEVAVTHALDTASLVDLLAMAQLRAEELEHVARTATTEAENQLALAAIQQEEAVGELLELRPSTEARKLKILVVGEMDNAWKEAARSGVAGHEVLLCPIAPGKHSNMPNLNRSDIDALIILERVTHKAADTVRNYLGKLPLIKYQCKGCPAQRVTSVPLLARWLTVYNQDWNLTAVPVL